MNKLKSIWQIEDLRKKILFTLLLILVFRLGCSIPVPFVSNTALDSMFSNDSIFGYMNMLSGGALSRCAFFALGVSPYINSSIITQLLCVALPSWEALQKETTGKDKLDEYTKRIALAMAAIMSIGYYFVLRNYGALEYMAGKSGFFAAVVIMATFLAGSQLSVWIGGRIDEFGIGNGVSILIFAGIVSRWTDINTIAHNIAVQVESGNWLYSLVGIGMVVAMLFAVWFVSYSDGAERRIINYVDQDIDGKDKYRITGMQSRSGTPTGPAMKYMAQKLKKETAEKRLLIVSTDGCSNSGRDGIQKTIKELSRYGILVVGAGIGSARTQVENEFGKNFIDIGNLEAMPQILCNIVKRNLA